MIKEITLDYFITKQQERTIEILKNFCDKNISLERIEEIKKEIKKEQTEKWNNLHTNGLDIGTITKYIINGRIVEYNNEFMFYNTKDKKLYMLD